MISSTSSRDIFCGFWKSGIDFPLVFHSNRMLTSHHQDDIGDFHIRDLEMTPKGQSRSKVKMHTFINWATVNIFVYMHPGPRSNRLDDTGCFHFCGLEITPSGSSEVKFFCGFWKSSIDFPLVFRSNPMLISHHQEDIGDFHIRDLQMTPKRSFKVKGK